MDLHKEKKDEILKLVREYADLVHNNKPFEAGDFIKIAGRIYDKDELANLVDSSLDFWLTAGNYTDLFENKLAAYLGLEYCIFVNSGSSANLLAFTALTSPLLGERAIMPGDEVITVAACFPTTISPIVQYGAIPVFIDITIPQYNIDVSLLENAVSEKTKAVMIAHTLGNPFDIAAVKMFCDKYGLWLIEDNCDALGSEYTLNGNTQRTGSFGDISTLSFYPAHHITTGEGGAVCTNDALLNKIIYSMRDWGRDCICHPGHDSICGNRFNRQLGELPYGYDHKYIYSHFGYNLKATDMQAAIGVAQLDKLDGFVAARQRNFNMLKDALSPLHGRFILPEACPCSGPSWFGFPITCKNNEKKKLTKHLEDSRIQTRVLFAGNIIRQPCFENMRKANKGYRIVGELPNTDTVMTDSFWLGTFSGINEQMIGFIADTVMKFYR